MNDVRTIRALQEDIRTRRVSPLDAVRACLARIEALNESLNAFITVLSDRALEHASVAQAQINAGEWRGPLHGVPVAIKDFYDTAGIRTTAAFEPFANRVPKRNAVAVAKLERAGAIIIGKTNMHRLGMGTTGLDSAFGPVSNPWNARYIAGGSSAGSAAAVATGMCCATLDTDAIGSCRLPAACCGVVGFKGTYGLIDPTGILDGEDDPGEMIRWFNHPGITTRTPEDAALVVNALADRRGRMASDYVEGLANAAIVRIGIATNATVDAEVAKAFERAIEDIRRLGYPTTGAAIPFRDPDGGLDTIEDDRKAIANRLFDIIDVLVLPTTTTAVPAVEAARADPQALSARNTAFANYYGLPAISVPCAFDGNGLPLGLQFVGRPWDDATVLGVAHRYATLRQPPVPSA